MHTSKTKPNPYPFLAISASDLKKAVVIDFISSTGIYAIVRKVTASDLLAIAASMAASTALQKWSERHRKKTLPHLRPAKVIPWPSPESARRTRLT
ncbi:hypothetical protein QJ48_24310 [Paenibacillus sp. A3]|uniref:hypothetical protein n=1 Tax=Paenibacillus sp. A3 TaxID=1337054 RepID=UPI0006D58A47|nr:hypothetical protein [Paenibacillus sp. A3]KPV57047.1 hypothetical protein QJ48_24310 [Paenibacillus sp. A3]